MLWLVAAAVAAPSFNEPPRLVYPEAARAHGAASVPCTVSFTAAPDGRISEVEPIDCAEPFLAAAREAMRVATVAPSPAEAHLTITLAFRHPDPPRFVLGGNVVLGATWDTGDPRPVGVLLRTRYGLTSRAPGVGAHYGVELELRGLAALTARTTWLVGVRDEHTTWGVGALAGFGLTGFGPSGYLGWIPLRALVHGGRRVDVGGEVGADLRVFGLDAPGERLQPYALLRLAPPDAKFDWCAEVGARRDLGAWIITLGVGARFGGPRA